MPLGDRKQRNTQACMKAQFLTHRQQSACALKIKIRLVLCGDVTAAGCQDTWNTRTMRGKMQNLHSNFWCL